MCCEFGTFNSKKSFDFCKFWNSDKYFEDLSEKEQIELLSYIDIEVEKIKDNLYRIKDFYKEETYEAEDLSIVLANSEYRLRDLYNVICDEYCEKNDEYNENIYAIVLIKDNIVKQTFGNFNCFEEAHEKLKEILNNYFEFQNDCIHNIKDIFTYKDKDTLMTYQIIELKAK